MKEPREFESERKRFGTTIVFLRVGKDEEEFTVHEDVICESSAFFKAAVKKEWKAGAHLAISLPEDDPQVVNTYIQWLYKGKIFTRSPPGEPGKDGIEYGQLINAYVLGEKIQDGHYKDAVIDSVIMATNTLDRNGKPWYPTGWLVNAAFEGTPPGSPLRKLLLDLWLYHGSEVWPMPPHVDFLQDLGRALFRLRNKSSLANPSDTRRGGCLYHSHAQDGPCYAKPKTGRSG